MQGAIQVLSFTFLPICLKLCQIITEIVIMLCPDVGADFRDIRPLDEARLRKLTVSRIRLIDGIDPNPAFVTELANIGCITMSQGQYIVDLTSSRDKNDKLLEFITRRSVADFKEFVKVLSREQAHLTRFMSSNGGEL